MPTCALERQATGLFSAVLLILVVGCSQTRPTPLEEVEDFGSNPGELRMLKYVPGLARAEISEQGVDEG
jgi:hypothetical protein